MGDQPEATPSSAGDVWAALSLGLGRCWVLDVVTDPGPAACPFKALSWSTGCRQGR